MKLTTISAGLLLAMSTAALFAHSGATGIVKERMDAMKSIASHMKIIGQMVSGQKTMKPKKLSTAANEIKHHAVAVKSMFPEGSDHSPSEVAPEIWTNSVEFNLELERFEQAAATFAKRAEEATATDSLAAPFAELGGTCKSCHQQFRIEKR